MVRLPFFALLIAASVALSCQKKAPPTATERPAKKGAETSPPSSEKKAGDSVRSAAPIDFIRNLDNCTVGHRGALIDLGDPTSRANYGANLVKPDIETFEREGATWIRSEKRLLTFTFYSNESSGAEGIAVGGRFRGGTAKSVTLLVNGRAVGDVPLVKGELAVGSLKSTSAVVTQGMNEVSVRFNGGARVPGALGEIDWIRVGNYDDDSAYSPPTRADILSSENLNGDVKRSLAVRGPGYVRCDAFIPAHSEFRGAFAVKGGQADVEVRLLRDRNSPRVIHSMHLDGGKSPKWAPLAVETVDTDTLGSIEVSVLHATKGARVLIGEPAVYAPAIAPHEEKKAAQNGVLIILGDVSAKSISPFGGPIPMPSLDTLASQGIRFDDHRGVTTLPHGEVSTLLSGLSPRDTGVVDIFARFARTAPFLAEALRQAGVVTGMFTANPLTSASFGFDRGWETFRPRTPHDESPATSVFEDASRWIGAHSKERFFAVIHARGGHPPWEAKEDALKKMAPDDYAGGVDPRHGGELLGRARHVPPLVRFTDADRARAWALYAHALAEHDRALGIFLDQLRKDGLDDDTAIFVTSDVAPDESAHVPFGDSEPLEERALSLPLIVRIPGEAKGVRSSVPTSALDVAPTLFAALGLTPPKHVQGASVFNASPGRVRVAAASNRVSARWGTFVLNVASGGRETKMCDLSLEPACVTDVRSTHPLTHSAFHRQLFDLLVLAPSIKTEREPANVDPPTASALRAWGIE